MIDPKKNFTEQPEYKEGIDWAVMHAPELAERYSSTEITGQALRGYLFKVAEGIYPHERDNPENDLRQTLFVAGAIRRIIDTLSFGPEQLREVFDIALEISQVYGAERWTLICFREMKAHDASWWRKKKGAASPNDVVNVLASRWWRTHGREKGVSRTSKWEILIDTLGTREMCCLAHLTNVEAHDGGEYKYWTVEGEENSFDVMSAPVYQREGGRLILIQGMGEIVG